VGLPLRQAAQRARQPPPQHARCKRRRDRPHAAGADRPYRQAGASTAHAPPPLFRRAGTPFATAGCSGGTGSRPNRRRGHGTARASRRPRNGGCHGERHGCGQGWRTQPARARPASSARCATTCAAWPQATASPRTGFISCCASMQPWPRSTSKGWARTAYAPPQQSTHSTMSPTSPRCRSGLAMPTSPPPASMNADELASDNLRQVPAGEVARPWMESLRDLSDETVMFLVRRGTETVVSLPLDRHRLDQRGPGSKDRRVTQAATASGYIH